MTIGNNELFLRKIENGGVEEPYLFSMAPRPVTVQREIARARLGKLPARRLKELAEMEARGETEMTVASSRRRKPARVELPNDDYRYYNKATSRILYSRPEWVVFWRGNGEYVYTFKKTGNWYLHGVGGMKHFGREGLTWSLIAPRLHARYLPPGYVLDSGAPCAFLRDGVDRDELYFILGWALTDTCNRILKQVLNHTRNIQSKDFERLPYPVWVGPASRRKAVSAVKALVERANAGEQFSFKSDEVRHLDELYAWANPGRCRAGMRKRAARQALLF